MDILIVNWTNFIEKAKINQPIIDIYVAYDVENGIMHNWFRPSRKNIIFYPNILAMVILIFALNQALAEAHENIFLSRDMEQHN